MKYTASPNPRILRVTGDNYSVSFLRPASSGRKYEWDRLKFEGGASALGSFASGLSDYIFGKSLRKVQIIHIGSSNLPKRTLLHRACWSPAKGHPKNGKWIIDRSPPVGDAEYIQSDVETNPPAAGKGGREKMRAKVQLIRYVSNSVISGEAEHIVRLSTPLVPAEWTPCECQATGNTWAGSQTWTEIVNVEQIARCSPVALGSSYESIARDILRFLGLPDGSPRGAYFQLGLPLPGIQCGQASADSLGGGTPPAPTIPFVTVIVRIDSACLLVYSRGRTGAKPEVEAGSKGNQELAALIYHPDKPAPLLDGPSKQIGGTGSLLAAAVALGLLKIRGKTGTSTVTFAAHFDAVVQAAVKGVRLCIAAQKCGLSFLGKKETGDLGGRLAKFAMKCGKEADAEKKEGKPQPITIKLAHSTTTREGSDEARGDDFEDLRSVHREWLIQDVRSRDWLMSAKKTVGARGLTDQPYAILAGCKKHREEAYRHVHCVKLGQASLSDRTEIEDYLALQSVLRSYTASANPDRPKPLNLSVFGPPGSGKSYGVKQLVTHCGDSGLNFSTKEILEFNMSQFGSVNDLAESLHRVRDMCMSGKIPVAFFDEFDSSFEGTPFGWLKYLLMPMQDAKFWDGNKQFSLGTCVLIFAGGINRTFQELNGRVRDADFVIAKGPDFISRLRGSLNIRSLNFPEDENEREKHRCRMRRAVLLNGLFEERHGKRHAPEKAPWLDKALTYAFLNIRGFRHGVRSLQAILEMSDFVPGETLRASSLPISRQIDMHVDAREWARLVAEGEDDLAWIRAAT